VNKKIVYLDAIVLPKTGQYLFEETRRGLLLSEELKKQNPTVECWNAGPKRGENPKKLFERLGKEDLQALVLSGSEKSVTTFSTDPWVKDYLAGLASFLDSWKKAKDAMPIFGICFAHQAIAQVEGGKVAATGHLKIGPVPVQSHAERPPLSEDFGRGEKKYIAFHEDQVTQAPRDMETLYASDYCPFQGFQHSKLPLITVQFHPEMNERILDVSEDREYWAPFNKEKLKVQEGDSLLRKIGDWFAKSSKG
jgi:GMP synthase-like glutamine amidotransferase